MNLIPLKYSLTSAQCHSLLLLFPQKFLYRQATLKLPIKEDHFGYILSSLNIDRQNIQNTQ